ncbi:MAG: polysaccharide biosynthesis C-terminal domain-containing protein, partial [Betaproteobacteria bacterium]
GVALAAPFIVLLALGPKWTDARTLLEIIAFSGITQVLQSNSYSALIALGRPGQYARISAFHVVVLLLFLLLLVPRYGAHGAAWAYLIAATATLPVNFFYITRSLEVRPIDVIANLWRPLLSAGLMYGIGRLWGPVLAPDAASSIDAILPLFACVAMGAATYVVADALLWLLSGRPAGAETWLLRKVQSAVRSLRERLGSPRSGK